MTNLTGTWTRLASSKNCRLLKNTGTSEVRLLVLTSVSLGTNFTAENNVTTVFSGVTSTNWYISDDCLKIKTDANVYAAPTIAGTFAPAASTSSWLSFDSSLNYALLPTAILKYSSSGNNYVPLHTFSANTFSAGAVLTAFGGNIVVYQTTTTVATMLVFVDNGGIVTRILSHSSTYSSAPKVITSPLKTKVLVYGILSGQISTYFYFINYAGSSSTALTFPTANVFDPANILILLEDNWMYLRQKATGLRAAGLNSEYAYVILLDTIVELSDSKIIVAADETSWTATFIRVLNNGSLFVLNQHSASGASPVVVKVWSH